MVEGQQGHLPALDHPLSDYTVVIIHDYTILKTIHSMSK